jgi:hypothetical protein
MTKRRHPACAQGVLLYHRGDHIYGFNSRSIAMGRINFGSAGFAAILLALSGQETMAQGLLQIEPHPFDSMLSPYPLGPLQKFGDLPSARAPWLAGLQQASAPPPAPAARTAQSQVRRRPVPNSESRQTALRAAAQHERQRGTVGSGSALALAPRTGERLPSRPFCFPSSTLHIQQNQECYAVAPLVRGRFEELLGK